MARDLIWRAFASNKFNLPKTSFMKRVLFVAEIKTGKDIFIPARRSEGENLAFKPKSVEFEITVFHLHLAQLHVTRPDLLIECCYCVHAVMLY